VQIADATKAKAAVVNEKLEWEELDKQEQVVTIVSVSSFARLTSELGTKEGRGAGPKEQRESIARFLQSKFITDYPIQSKLAEFADGKLKGEKLAKAKERYDGSNQAHRFVTLWLLLCFFAVNPIVIMVSFRAKAAKKVVKGRSVQFV
jgi:hypothetical protein